MGLPVPAALRHPLLERDFVRLCARPSFFWTRTGAAALCAALVLSTYAGVRRFQGPDFLGVAVHMQFTWIAMLYVKGQAMIEAAQALPQERASATLPALLTAPLTPRRLAAGFLASRILFAFTAVLGLLPLEGLALLLGGVSASQVLRTLGGLLFAGVFGGAIGFLGGHAASDTRRATAKAGFLSMSVVILLPVGLAALGAFANQGWLPLLAEGGKGLEDGFLRVAGASLLLTPAGYFLSTVASGVGWFPLSFGDVALWTTLSTVAWVALAILVGGRRLRTEMEHEAIASARAATLRAWIARLRGKEAPASRRGIVGHHPLRWKEGRPPRTFLALWGPRAGCLALAAFLGYLWFDPAVQGAVMQEVAQSDFWHFDILLCAIPWVVSLVPLGAAGTFIPEERERGALELLRASPIPMSEYVLARPLGLLRRAWPLFAILGAFAIVGMLRGQVHVLTPIAWALGTALVYPFLYLLCYQRGMGAPSVRIATRRSSFPVFLMLVVWPILVGIACAFLRFRKPEIFIAASPPFSMAAPLVAYVESWEPDRDAERFALAGCVAAAGWGLAGIYLWRTLPRRLEVSLHQSGGA